MRIVAGKYRGLRLTELGRGDAAAHLRPTSDRVRESLFSMLSGGRFGDPLTGARVLDLFAGSGALGLEALSRGAAHATFVDSGAKAHALIARNIAITGANEVTVLRRDATRLGRCESPTHDLVFLDPPYGKGLGKLALASAVSGGWLGDAALVVWEEGAAQTPPPGFVLLERKRYGDTHVTLLRRNPHAET